VVVWHFGNAPSKIAIRKGSLSVLNLLSLWFWFWWFFLHNYNVLIPGNIHTESACYIPVLVTATMIFLYLQYNVLTNIQYRRTDCAFGVIRHCSNGRSNSVGQERERNNGRQGEAKEKGRKGGKMEKCISLSKRKSWLCAWSKCQPAQLTWCQCVIITDRIDISSVEGNYLSFRISTCMNGIQAYVEKR